MINEARKVQIDLPHQIMAAAEETAYYNEIRRQDALDVVRNQATNNATTQSRAALMEGSSSSMDPRRNINAECGFPETASITLENYRYMYEREPIAARVVEVWPKACWKITPDLRERDDVDAPLTSFEEAWRNLPKELDQENWLDHGEADESNPLWEVCQNVDIACGVGTFGVILIGVDDGKKLEEPIDGVNEHGKKTGSKTKTTKLTYLRVFSEIQVTVNSFVNDPTSPRNGKPEFYQIVMNDPDSSSGIQPDTDMLKVHWSRVVHVADNTLSSKLFGAPRMRSVLNPLLSLIKIYGGDAEMWWSGASRDLILESHPQLGGKVRVNMPRVRADLEKFRTGLQRELVLLGLSAKDRAPAVSDPTSHVQIQIDAICIRIEVPKRVFMGSERGELSSGQDADEMDERANGRRNRFCTPAIIAPLVNRLIVVGVLPVPAQYYVDWDRIDLMSPLEKAQVSQARMEALAKYVGGGLQVVMAPADLLTRELGYDAEEAKQILESADEYAMESEEAIGLPVDEGSGLLAPIDGEEDVEALKERSELLGMVGGITGMLDILKSLDEGAIPHTTAIQLVALFYQIGETEAAAIVGKERPEKVPEEPLGKEEGGIGLGV